MADKSLKTAKLQGGFSFNNSNEPIQISSDLNNIPIAPPENPINGNVYFSTLTKELFVRVEGQWQKVQTEESIVQYDLVIGETSNLVSWSQGAQRLDINDPNYYVTVAIVTLNGTVLRPDDNYEIGGGGNHISFNDLDIGEGDVLTVSGVNDTDAASGGGSLDTDFDLQQKNVLEYESSYSIENPAIAEQIRLSGSGSFSELEPTNEILEISLDSEWLAKDDPPYVPPVNQVERVAFTGQPASSAIEAVDEIVTLTLDSEWLSVPDDADEMLTYTFSFPHLDTEIVVEFDSNTNAVAAAKQLDTEAFPSEFTITIDTDTEHPTVIIDTNSASAADDSSLTVTNASNSTNVTVGSGATNYEVTVQGVDSDATLSSISWYPHFGVSPSESYTETIPFGTSLKTALNNFANNANFSGSTLSADTDSDYLILTYDMPGVQFSGANSLITVDQGTSSTFGLLGGNSSGPSFDFTNVTFSSPNPGSLTIRNAFDASQTVTLTTSNSVNYMSFVEALADESANHAALSLTAAINSVTGTGNPFFFSAVQDDKKVLTVWPRTASVPGSYVEFSNASFDSEFKSYSLNKSGNSMVTQIGANGVDSEQLTYTFDFPHIDTDDLTVEFPNGTTAETAINLIDSEIRSHYNIPDSDTSIDTDSEGNWILNIDTQQDSDIEDVSITVTNADNSTKAEFTVDRLIHYLYPPAQVSGTTLRFTVSIISQSNVEAIISELPSDLTWTFQFYPGANIDTEFVITTSSSNTITYDAPLHRLTITNYTGDPLPFWLTQNTGGEVQSIVSESGTQLLITDGFAGHPATTVTVGNFTYTAGHGGNDSELFAALESANITGWTVTPDTDTDNAVILTANVAGHRETESVPARPTFTVNHGTGNGTFEFDPYVVLREGADTEWDAPSSKFFAELIDRPVPEGINSPGKSGEMAIGETNGTYYLYLCVADNIWHRTQFNEWSN